MNFIDRVKSWINLEKSIYVWAVVVIGSNLQFLIHPHLDWALALLVAGISVRTLAKQRFEVPWPIASGAVLLVISICMTALVSPRPVYDLAQAGKLALILIAGLTFFVSRPDMARAAFRTQVFLVFANVILILWGGRLSRALARVVTPDGRWQTVFNAPGTLGGVGLGVLVYGLYLLLRTRHRIKGALIVACAFALVYFENSRTMTLLTIAALVFLTGVWIWERWGSFRRVMVVSLVAIAGVSIAMTVLDLPIPSRFERMVRLVREEGVVAGLTGSDPVRASMMQAAIEAVSQFPLLGSGMGSLAVETKSGWMRVHMAYLQMWADAGLLAFVGYLWIALGWLVWLPAAMQTLRQDAGSEDNALTYNGIFMLMALVLANFLHTYSTEWAQWLPYLMSVSFLYDAASKSRGVVSDEFHGRNHDVQPAKASPTGD